jgi:outer membrane biosynthesis protein TonB
MRGSPDTLSWHACLSRQGRSDRSHFTHLLTDLTGKLRYSPRSNCCANHQGKAESRSPTSSASSATRSSASPDPKPRPREKVSASPDLRPQPQPRPREKVSTSPDPRPQPREKSPPRPTWASDRPRYRGCTITLLLASCLRLWRNKTGVPSKVTPVTGNDGSPRAPMTSDCSQPPTKARQRQQDPCHADSCASIGLKVFLWRPR